MGMKNKFLDLGDLEAAFEAVKGVLFGPLDAASVKHKFNEIVREKKQERELESNPMSLLGHGREEAKEREYRTRNDRDLQRFMVMSLLNAAQQQRLAMIYNGIDSSRGKGVQVGKRLTELDGKLDRWHDKLMANAAYKDGKAYFRYEDGRVVDVDGNSAPPEQVAGIDFTGKTTAEEKAAYDAARTEVHELKEGLGNALGDLDALEADLNRRIAENPDKADEIMDEVERSHQGIDRRMEDIGERVRELDRAVPTGDNEVAENIELGSAPIQRLKL
jgi:hypothetical protein